LPISFFQISESERLLQPVWKCEAADVIILRLFPIGINIQKKSRPEKVKRMKKKEEQDREQSRFDQGVQKVNKRKGKNP